jgi:hypothetical protein
VNDETAQRIANEYAMVMYKFAGCYVSNVRNQPGRGAPIAIFQPQTPAPPRPAREHGLGEQVARGGQGLLAKAHTSGGAKP